MLYIAIICECSKHEQSAKKSLTDDCLKFSTHSSIVEWIYLFLSVFYSNCNYVYFCGKMCIF